MNRCILLWPPFHTFEIVARIQNFEVELMNYTYMRLSENPVTNFRWLRNEQCSPTRVRSGARIWWKVIEWISRFSNFHNFHFKFSECRISKFEIWEIQKISTTLHRNMLKIAGKRALGPVELVLSWKLKMQMQNLYFPEYEIFRLLAKNSGAPKILEIEMRGFGRRVSYFMKEQGRPVQQLASLRFWTRF